MYDGISREVVEDHQVQACLRVDIQDNFPQISLSTTCLNPYYHSVLK